MLPMMEDLGDEYSIANDHMFNPRTKADFIYEICLKIYTPERGIDSSIASANNLFNGLLKAGVIIPYNVFRHHIDNKGN